MKNVSGRLHKIKNVTSGFELKETMKLSPIPDPRGFKADTTKTGKQSFSDNLHKNTEKRSDHVIVPSLTVGPESKDDSATAGPIEGTTSLEASKRKDNSAARPQVQLNVTFISETKGYVQSPNWGRVTWPADTTMDSSVRIAVPEKHVLLLSWWIRLQYPCVDDVLELHIDDRNASRHDGALPSWSLCTAGRYPGPKRFHADSVHVRFALRSGTAWRTQRGFRLLFSFHQDPDLLPRRLKSDGLWNCSLPHWPMFRQHVRCNLRVECAGGEDEAGCGHESEACGPGRISAAGGCYVFVASREPVSWNEARGACRRVGGYLASFNTDRERLAVGRHLKNAGAFYLFAGLMSQDPLVPDMYRDLPTWDDETVAYYAERLPKDTHEFCSSVDFSRDTGGYVRLREVSCRRKYPADILCETERSLSPPGAAVDDVILPNVTSTRPSAAVVLVSCPSGHLTHTALACDVHSACWGQGRGSQYTCDAPTTSLPPSFACADEVEFVPYSLVCDYQQDCIDGSDEDFCVFPACGFEPFPCGNKQCVSPSSECNGLKDCTNGLDERLCFRRPSSIFSVRGLDPLPYVIGPRVSSFHLTTICFSLVMCSNVFTCSTINISLPLFLRCNGVNDCPGREDERGCDACPGLYRCRGSKVCLHRDSLCDGVRSCPRNDDETFCRLPCPQSCTCHALSAQCRRRFSARHAPDLRFLEAPGSGVTLADLVNRTMLVHLGLGACGLRYLHHVYLPNVRFLDVSDNLLTHLTVNFSIQFPNLRELLLDRNPLESICLDGSEITNMSFVKVTHLKLSNVIMTDLDADDLAVFPRLQVLNLSGSRVDNVHGEGFKLLTELTTLDVRQCALTSVSPDLLRTLPKLTAVFANNYKLCCPAVLPKGFDLARCHAPRDEISSCDALLRSDVYRALLSVISALSLVGNLASFTYRSLIRRSRSDLGFGVFVAHLCVSDLLMGIYLAVIGVADRFYLGDYLWNDVRWRSSPACSAAGFLSLLSSEVSAFLIGLITLDRVLVLRFPFRQLRFRPSSARLACALVWTGGAVLAAIPLLPATRSWRFYGQNGICVPLPVTQRRFPGQSYSFAVFIVLNFLLFLLIAVGQFTILYVVRTTRLTSTETNRASKDATVASRLITVAMSDFLCWFPIGVLGLLAAAGTPVPGEVNVALAILALPLNAALNPFLYTFNVIQEHRRRGREERLRAIVAMAHG